MDRRGSWPPSVPRRRARHGFERRRISRSFTTSCVCLELRLLPSSGVTRLQRYYKPLRHPTPPSLSLAGVWLVVPDHAMGLPVLRTLSLCTCRRQYPGAAAWVSSSLISPTRVSLPRNCGRVGLHIVLFEACVLIPEEAAPQFRDDVAPRNGMMPPPDSEMIAPP